MSNRSWPLLLLGVAAFIPGLGFAFGAAAVVWGLFSDRPQARLAVALGASGAALQLVIGLGLMLWLQNGSLMREAKAAKAATDLTRLVAELDTYKAQTGAFPPSLYALGGDPFPERFVNIHDPTAGLFRQQPYIYRLSQTGETFDLLAVGPDGKPDTPDDIRPALPDSLRAASGYRTSRQQWPAQ